MDKGGIINCHFPFIDKLQSIDIAQAVITVVSTEGGDTQIGGSGSEVSIDASHKAPSASCGGRLSRRRTDTDYKHNHLLPLRTERGVHPFGGGMSS